MHKDTHAPASGQLFHDASTIKVIAWKPLPRNMLLGFADLELPSGMVLFGCAVCSTNGRAWVSMPSKPQMDSDGKHRVDQGTGKRLYTPAVDFANRQARQRFQDRALAALKPFIEGAAK